MTSFVGHAAARLTAGIYTTAACTKDGGARDSYRELHPTDSQMSLATFEAKKAHRWQKRRQTDTCVAKEVPPICDACRLGYRVARGVVSRSCCRASGWCDVWLQGSLCSKAVASQEYWRLAQGERRRYWQPADGLAAVTMICGWAAARQQFSHCQVISAW